jgi:hypothetical protein
LHKKDLDLLNSIKAYFGGLGIISVSKSKNMCAFRVSSPKQILEVVLPHFYKYPLVTKKYIDYQLFKNIVEIILNKEHLTERGLQEIVNLRASLNLGLSDKLKGAFPNTIPVERKIFTKQQIPDPQ